MALCILLEHLPVTQAEILLAPASRFPYHVGCKQWWYLSPVFEPVDQPLWPIDVCPRTVPLPIAVASPVDGVPISTISVAIVAISTVSVAIVAIPTIAISIPVVAPVALGRDQCKRDKEEDHHGQIPLHTRSILIDERIDMMQDSDFRGIFDIAHCRNF